MWRKLPRKLAWLCSLLKSSKPPEFTLPGLQHQNRRLVEARHLVGAYPSLFVGIDPLDPVGAETEQRDRLADGAVRLAAGDDAIGGAPSKPWRLMSQSRRSKMRWRAAARPQTIDNDDPLT